MKELKISKVQPLKDRAEINKLLKDYPKYNLDDKWLENFTFSISDILLHERGVKDSGTMTFVYLNFKYIGSKVSNIKRQVERVRLNYENYE